jgi:isoquinoline 1-oxidoreductase beta subunit
LPLQRAGVAASSFAASPVPRIDQIPPLHVRLVDSAADPTGAGESTMTAGAAAIANAVFDATGRRPAQLPLRPSALVATAT